MNCKIRFAALLFFVCLSFTYPAFADHAVVPNTGQNKYKQVRLIPEIYNRSLPGLTDILIKDSENNAVPYFIHNYTYGHDIFYTEYETDKVYTFHKEGDSFFDFAIQDFSLLQDAMVNALTVTANHNNFAKNIDVYGSFDGNNWTFIQTTTIYDVDGIKKHEIPLPQPEKYGFYRIGVLKNAEEIVLTSLAASFNERVFQRKYFEERISPPYTVTHEDSKTIIELYGVKHLTISDVVISSESMFKRSCWVAGRLAGRRYEIYNLTFSNISLSDMVIPMVNGVHINTDDTMTLVIEDNDNQPIDINGIEIIYLADNLVFDGGGQSDEYFIEYHSTERTTAPRYDIAQYKDRVLSEEIDNLYIETIIKATEDAPSLFNHKLIFDIVVYLAIFMLLVVIVVKIKKG